MATRDIAKALARADFRWLWLGSLCSSFAMNMQIIARGWLVYTLTSSALDLAWVTLSFMIPTVLLSLWGGVVADRFPKRTIIILGQSLNCVATLVMGAIIFSGTIEFWDFIWFGLFNGSVLALSMPARQAFVPELVPDRLVFTATSLNTTSWNLSRIIGPAFAGLLIAWVAAGDTQSFYGVGIVYCVIAGLYLVSAVGMALVRKRGVVRPADGQTALADVADGFRYVWRNPPVFGLIVLSILPFMFGMTINTLLPAFNEDILDGGPDDLGLLISAMGVGAIVGSLMMASMGELRNKAAWLVATCAGWGAAIAGFGFSRTAFLAMAVIAGVGWVSSWNMSLNRGLLQLQVTPGMRGRILSIDMMSHGLMPLGVIPISFIAEAWDVAVAMIVSGSVLVVLTLTCTVLMTSIRTVDQGLPVGPK